MSKLREAARRALTALNIFHGAAPSDKISRNRLFLKDIYVH